MSHLLEEIIRMMNGDFDVLKLALDRRHMYFTSWSFCSWMLLLGEGGSRHVAMRSVF